MPMSSRNYKLLFAQTETEKKKKSIVKLPTKEWTPVLRSTRRGHQRGEVLDTELEHVNCLASSQCQGKIPG
jgi:hypothetical protein